MAMHHRRHNPAGGANPFTGRSLPTSRNGGGGGGYHGNSPSLVPSMAKKVVFIVVTFTMFFYVMFAPEYDDVPYESNRSSIKKKESATNNGAIDTSFVDLSKKPQSEPVKLNLPNEITPDPQDNNVIEKMEEKEVESADYEDQSMAEDEEEEGRMTYNSNDQGEQFTDTVGEGSEDTTAEAEVQLSPGEKIYGAHVHVDDEEGEGSGEGRSQSDPFLGLGDESEEKEDKETALDYSRGGLRGSKSANKKDPFGRQEKTDDEEEEYKKEEEVVESSRDEPVNIIEDKTFYKNQSPLELPIAVVEEDSIKSTNKKSMEDVIDEQVIDNKTTAIPCQDDPDFRYKGHVDHNCEYVVDREKCDKLHNGQKVGIVSCPDSCGMVNECLDQIQELEGSHIAVKKNEAVVEDKAKTIDEVNSEAFSIKEKAAFEAKYGSSHKSMEEELEKEDVLESSESKNHPSLEIPIVVASDVAELNNTEVGHVAKNDSRGHSMEVDSDNQHKSMADEVDKEEEDINDKDLKFKKTEDLGDESKTVKNGLSDTPKVKTMSNGLDAEEEKESDDQDEDESTKDIQSTSELGNDIDGDSEANKGASSVESDSKVNKEALSVKDNFKEYLITNSEDEPNRDEKNRESLLEESKVDEANLIAKDDNISKDDKSKESDADEDGNVENRVETVTDNGSNVLEQGVDVDKDSKHKKAVVDTEKNTLYVADDEGKTEDTDEPLNNTEKSNDASELGEAEDKDAKANRSSTIVGAVDESPKGGQPSNDEKSVFEDEEKGEDTDEPLKNVRSDDTPEKDAAAPEDAKVKKSKSIRDAADEKLIKATQKVERKQTASDEGAVRGGDSLVQVDIADEESKVKSIDNGDSEDESQEVNTDLGGSSAVLDNGNKTTSQIEKSEGASESVMEAKGNEDDKEESDIEVAFIDSNIGGFVKESDTEKKDNVEAKASRLDESEGNTAESIAQNEDKISLDSLADASKDKKRDEIDVSEKLKDEVKYAKIASDNEEPAANEDVIADKETGDLGEAIKQNDAPLDDEETADKKDDERSSKLDSEVTKIIQSYDKGDNDEESVSKMENDEEVDVAVDTDGSIVDKTANNDADARSSKLDSEGTQELQSNDKGDRDEEPVSKKENDEEEDVVSDTDGSIVDKTAKMIKK
ncbi:hypothetical protein ACHAWT_007194 [Skeletonema menzelii]